MADDVRDYQREARRYEVFKDQHGRKWGSQIELKTGHYTGHISCLHLTPSGGRVPLPTPQQYFKAVPNEPWRTQIDYDSWLAEAVAANRQYRQQVIEACNKKNFAVPEDDEPIPAAVLAIVGKPPVPVEPIRAARAGNPYVLGLTDRVDVRFAHYFAKPDAEDDSDYGTLVDSYGELEEAVDPDATGGKREPVRVPATKATKPATRKKTATVGAADDED